MVLLGGKHPRARVEVHDIVFAVGQSLHELRPALCHAWFGSAKGLHIDAWAQLNGVRYAGQPYAIVLSNRASAEHELKLYFLNLGGMLPQQFGEQHRYRVVAAFNLQQAKQQGLAWAKKHWQGAHVDAVFDVDDCMPIDSVDGRYINLYPCEHAENTWQNCYIPISAQSLNQL